MNLSILIAFIVVAFLAYIAQAQRCPGEPRNPICSGRKDEGRGVRGCRRREMWYYNTRRRSCLKMRYRGCGGNRNRYCSKALCELGCRR